jgi:hypothetical protein
MATTALFVELIVTGVGAFTALALMLTATMGAPDLLINDTTALIFAFPFLAFSYVLGIIVDRFSDYVYGLFSQRDRESQFASVAEYHNAKRLIRYHSERMWLHLEYTRSRLRICRGWSLNCVFLLISGNLWIWLQTRPLGWQVRSSAVVSGLLALVFVGCVFSFRALRKKYRIQVFEKHKLLLHLGSADRFDAADSAGTRAEDGPPEECHPLMKPIPRESFVKPRLSEEPNVHM